MSPSEFTFMDLAVDGLLPDVSEAIDDFIEDWHKSLDDVRLSEWLGFTDAEYALFVESPKSLELIVAARRKAASDPCRS